MSYDPVENFRRVSGLDIFERQRGRDEPGGYKFVCPGVMLSDDNVHIGFRERQWELSYTDSDGRYYVGRAESQVAAYLALIADRYGLVATFADKPEGAK